MALVEPEGNNRLLQDVLARPGNDTCADCGNPGKKEKGEGKKSFPSSRSFAAGRQRTVFRQPGLVKATAKCWGEGKLAEWCRVHRFRVKGRHVFEYTLFFSSRRCVVN